MLTIKIINMVKKINTKLSKNNWYRLKNLDDGSIDKNLNVLMDIVEDSMPFVNYSEEMKSVTIYSDTYQRLDGFHITSSESRDNIITRMFIEYDKLNKQLEEHWIPFRLTSPLNKRLSLTGMLEINSSQLIFNDDAIGYVKELPSSYMVNGEDLTKEFNSWVSLLNWDKIKNLIRNDEELFTFKDPLYYLEVNYLTSKNNHI